MAIEFLTDFKPLEGDVTLEIFIKAHLVSNNIPLDGQIHVGEHSELVKYAVEHGMPLNIAKSFMLNSLEKSERRYSTLEEEIFIGHYRYEDETYISVQT